MTEQTASLDLENLVEPTAGFRVRQYNHGEILFFEDDLSTTVYQVRSGLVKLTRTTGQGRGVITSLCFPGDLIGIEVGSEKQTCRMTAICVGETELSLVPRASFSSALESNPSLWLELLQRQQRQLREMSDMLVGMAAERVETRAARALLTLARHLGKVETDSALVPMPLTRQEFADFIGSTVETAIRVLSRFRKQGLVDEGRGWMRFKLESMHQLLAA